MVRYENKAYRIEEYHDTPLPFSLDRKESSDEHICLVNIGWFASLDSAIRAMNRDAYPELR